MEVYLIKKETNEVIETFNNVSSWGYNYVEYVNNGHKAKIYCNEETEYFTDKYEEKEILEEIVDNVEK